MKDFIILIYFKKIIFKKYLFFNWKEDEKKKIINFIYLFEEIGDLIFLY